MTIFFENAYLRAAAVWCRAYLHSGGEFLTAHGRSFREKFLSPDEAVHFESAGIDKTREKCYNIDKTRSFRAKIGRAQKRTEKSRFRNFWHEFVPICACFFHPALV